VKRGDVFDARLDPIEGSEQAGIRPVVIVSRDAINLSSSVIIAVPCTTYRSGQRVYPSQVLLQAGDGGLTVDSLALGEQIRAVAKSRLLRQRGSLAPQSLDKVSRALMIALDLP